MCGLVGVFGNLNIKSDQVFEQLLIVDSIRGMHSTGVAFINEFKPNIVKEVGDPFQLMELEDYENGFKMMNRAIIGHNRYATIGRITADNAHPFQDGHIIGAHNGTLNNHHGVLDKKSHMVVDSQMLIHTIAERGIQKSIENLDGAWALTWWDAKHKTMNFLRNKERSLFLAFSHEDDQLYWASEKWMLEAVLCRNGVKHREILSFAEDIHYCLSYDFMSKKILLDSKEEVKSMFSENMSKTYSSYRKKGGYVSTNNVHNFPVVKHQKPTDGAVQSALNQQLKLLSEHPCIGIRGVFKCVGRGIDVHGATYVLLHSVDYPNSTYIRMNVHAKSDPDKDYLGKYIEADVQEKPFFNQTLNYGYLKANHSSHRIIEDYVEGGNHEKQYTDASGKLISKKEWLKKYGTCAWCDGDVDPESTRNHISSSQSICADCMSKPEIADLVH